MTSRDKSTQESTNITNSISGMKDKVAGAIDPSIVARLQGALGGSDTLQKLGDMSENIRQAASRITEISAYNQVADKLAEQFKAIDGLRLNIPEMPSIPELLPSPEVAFHDMLDIENPLVETNERLKNIEERFDKMEKIALNAAEIATSLQSSAAVFLDKFETAARDNDRTTKRAVTIGVLALIVAILIPISQSLYAELFRAPSDAATTQFAISEIKREIQSLRQSQMTVADKVAEALDRNGHQATQDLKEIRDILAKLKK